MDRSLGGEESQLSKSRMDVLKQQGSRKRGRLHLRWEDCLKRDVRKAEEDDKWREKAVNREKWEMTTAKAVQPYKN